MPYTRRAKDAINPALFSRCSTCSFQAGVQQRNAPRRSSSRSLSGLMYEREFWMSSTVKRIAAVAAAGSRRRNNVRIKKVYVLIMDRRARKNEDTKSQNNEAAKIDERRPVAVSPNEISFEPQPFLPGGGTGLRLSRVVIAMDRAGLAVRTESRDHLAPIALGPTTNGRRSRAGSPTRSHHQKSPSMSPLADD